MAVHFTCQIVRDTSVDSPKRDGAEFELDALANWQPVLLSPKLSGSGMMRRLCYHTSERVLDALKTVNVVLRRSMEELRLNYCYSN